MDKYTQGRLDSQVRRVRQCRRQMVEDQDLCFTRLLPKEQVEAALERHQVHYPRTPVHAAADDLDVPVPSARVRPVLPGGRGATAGLLVCRRTWLGQCQDRPLLQGTPASAREALGRSGPPAAAWSYSVRFQPTELLGGRPIKIADGTTVSMPDTPANQKAYPQQSAQKKGLGFPILRLVGLISLSCGAVLDVAMGPYRGKRTGETALLRQLLDRLEAGDILLADAIFSNYWTIALLLERGVDLLGRHDGTRRVDFRQGQRLGRYDHRRVLAQTAPAVVDEPESSTTACRRPCGFARPRWR